MEGIQATEPAAEGLAAPATPVTTAASESYVPVPSATPDASPGILGTDAPAPVEKPRMGRRKKVLAALFAVLIVLAIAGGAAAKLGVYRKIHDRYTAGTLSVKVSEGSYALAGATLTFRGTTYTTDSSGKLTLDNLPAGSYDYTLTKDGYQDAKGTLTLHKGDNDLQSLLLTKLPEKAYSVKGFVKDVIGSLPVVNVQVTLGNRTAVTDPSGEYAFDKQVPGDVSLSFSKSGYVDRQMAVKVADQDIMTAKVPLVPSGQLVFVSNRDGQRHLYTSAYDGGGQLVFASNGIGEDFAPVVAPDNAHVAFDSTRLKVKDGFGNDAANLYVATLDGKSVIKVSDDVNATIKPTWSPNGQKLYYSAYSSAKYDQTVYRVYDVASGKLTDLGEQANETAFSPDGKLIAYYAFGSQDVSVASPTPTPVPSPSVSPEASPSPTPLPSPTPVANQVSLNIVKVLNIATGARTVLVKRTDYLSGLTFSADGGSLSYEAIVSGTRRRFQVKLSDSTQNEVPALSVAKRITVPSPSQQQQAFIEARDGHVDLYVTDASGGNEKRLTTIGVLSGAVLPHWDASGRYLTFAVHRDGEDGIYAVALAGGDPQKVTDYYSEN